MSNDTFTKNIYFFNVTSYALLISFPSEKRTIKRNILKFQKDVIISSYNNSGSLSINCNLHIINEGDIFFNPTYQIIENKNVLIDVSLFDKYIVSLHHEEVKIKEKKKSRSLSNPPVPKRTPSRSGSTYGPKLKEPTQSSSSVRYKIV